MNMASFLFYCIVLQENVQLNMESAGFQIYDLFTLMYIHMDILYTEYINFYVLFSVLSFFKNICFKIYIFC